MREEARVVIVGGGAMGVGLLYHLAHEGWTDTLLVEKGELTSGSTWHAAGLVPNFIGSLNMAKVHEHAIDLYARLEMGCRQVFTVAGHCALPLLRNRSIGFTKSRTPSTLPALNATWYRRQSALTSTLS